MCRCAPGEWIGQEYNRARRLGPESLASPAALPYSYESDIQPISAIVDLLISPTGNAPILANCQMGCLSLTYGR